MLQQAIEERSPKSDIENDIITESEGKNSRRKKPAPEETRKVYKLMRLLPDGKLQTLFIGRETYELGKWYDADAPGMDVLEKQKQDYFYLFDENNNIVDSRPIKYGKKNRISGLSKKDIETANENNQRWVAVGRYANGGRKYANMGINGAEGVTDYAMRPGIHAGSLPVMTQIGSGSTRDIRDNNLVWVEGEVAYGNGAPEEAAANGGEITTHIPVDGGYEKGTSSFVTKGMNWYISGAFLPKRIMGDVEAREIIDKFNQENGGNVPHDFMRRDGKVFNAETMQLEDAPEGWKESYNDGKGKNSRKRDWLRDTIKTDDPEYLFTKEHIENVRKVAENIRKQNPLRDKDYSTVVTTHRDTDWIYNIPELKELVDDGKMSVEEIAEEVADASALHLRRSKKIVIFADSTKSSKRISRLVLHEYGHAWLTTLDSSTYTIITQDFWARANTSKDYADLVDRVKKAYSKDVQPEELLVDALSRVVTQGELELMEKNTSNYDKQLIDDYYDYIGHTREDFVDRQEYKATINGTRKNQTSNNETQGRSGLRGVGFPGMGDSRPLDREGETTKSNRRVEDKNPRMRKESPEISQLRKIDKMYEEGEDGDGKMFLGDDYVDMVKAIYENTDDYDLQDKLESIITRYEQDKDDWYEYAGRGVDDGIETFVESVRDILRNAEQGESKNSRKGTDLYRDKEEYKEGQVLDIKGNLDGYTVEGMTMPYNHPETLLEAWRNKHPNYYAFLSDDGRGIEVYPVEGGKTRLEALYSKARTSKQRQQYAERKARQMRDRAESTAKPLGVKVNIIEPGTESDADRLKSKGWYDTNTGEILSRIVPSADLRLV